MVPAPVAEMSRAVPLTLNSGIRAYSGAATLTVLVAVMDKFREASDVMLPMVLDKRLEPITGAALM